MFKPDFFVVGAQKAGTTTLHEWLEKSSEISLPVKKETHFFMDEEKFSKGLAWYEMQFDGIDGANVLVGEIDPEYMYFPECAERIKSVVTSPKLIVVLRDPLSRARSHYQMSVRRGYEPLSFSDALLAEAARLKEGGRFSAIHHSYIDRGLYAKQIKRLRSEFPDSKMLILRFEDLFNSQASADESLRKISAFLNIDLNQLSVDVTRRENPASEPRFSVLRDFIYGKGRVKKYIGKLIPSDSLKLEIMQFLDGMNLKAVQGEAKAKKMESENISSEIKNIFLSDLRELQEMVDIDISGWVGRYEEQCAK